jgi:hypothetical protein
MTISGSVLPRLISALNGCLHFGNPLQISLSRVLPGNGPMTMSDRETGVTVSATPGSYRMFAETWYDRVYDVPGCPLRGNDIVIDIGANQATPRHPLFTWTALI